MAERWSYDPATCTVFDQNGKVVASQVNARDGRRIEKLPAIGAENKRLRNALEAVVKAIPPNCFDAFADAGRRIASDALAANNAA